MTENYLVRILTDELTSFTDLPFWQIQAKVCDAVHRAMRQTDGLDEFINALQNRIVRFSYKKDGRFCTGSYRNYEAECVIDAFGEDAIRPKTTQYRLHRLFRP